MIGRTCAAAIVFFALVAAAPPASAQTPPSAVAAIKNLYDSAAYEEALAALDTLRSRDAGPAARTRDLLIYRALCLLALERTGDAEQAIAELIVNDPLYRPERDASPPWVRAVGRVQSRMAPAIVKDRYAAGKGHFDRGEFSAAAADFEAVVGILGNPTLEPAVVSSLSDLGTLSRGFLEVSRASAAPGRAPATPAPNATTSIPAPAAVAPENVTASNPSPATATSASVSVSNPAPAPDAPANAAAGSPSDAAAAAPASPGARRTTPAAPASGPGTGGWISQFMRFRIYSSSDTGVTPPKPVQQDLPPFRAGVAGRFDGQIEVVVSETGNVEAAIVRESVHPLYDRLLARAAELWKYVPAMKDGVPVKFRLTVRVSVDSTD